MECESDVKRKRALLTRKRAWSVIGEKVHEVLKHTYYRGASVIAVENLDVVGYLRYYWVRDGDRKHENYNYKVSMFKCSIIDRVAWRASLYGLKVTYVEPQWNK